MQQGIIYRVLNKITSKSYIGQTRVSLSIRVTGHYTDSKRHDYKFSRALRKYSKDDWEWIIIEEVEIDKLDERERYYIANFDSYKNGYNSNLGGETKGVYHHNYNYTIYEVFHPSYGVITGTKQELSKIEPALYDIDKIFKEKRTHIKGWVLFKDKDNYDKLLHLHEFYHPHYGVVKDTLLNISKIYFNNTKNLSSLLVAENKNKYPVSSYGWILAKYKNEYEDIINKCKVTLTLEHSEHGRYTMRAFEFQKEYGLDSGKLTCLKNKQRKSHKGWILIE